MADRSVEIAALQAVLNSGTKSVTVDGVTTSFSDASQIRKRIRELQVETDGDQRRKPRISTVDLGAAW